MPLKYKLFLPLLLVSLAGGLFLNTVWLPHNQKLLTQDHELLVSTQLQSIAQAIIPSLLEEDIGTIYPTLDALAANNENWRVLQLLDEKRRLVYPLHRQSIETNEHVHKITFPLRYQDKFIGELLVVADFTARHEELSKQNIQLVAALFGSVLILGLVAAFTTEFTVRRPISQLAVAAEHVGSGNYNEPLPEDKQDEVGLLIRRFDAMRRSIQEQRIEIENQFSALQEAQHESMAKTIQIVSILENTSDAYLALDQHLCFTYVNSKAEAMFQTSGDNFLGQNIWDQFPELSSFLYKPMTRLLSQGDPIMSEIFYPPLSLWLECLLAPLDLGVAMYIRDITERKSAELALRKSEGNIRAILDNVADAIITANKSGIILSFNPAAERIFGYKAVEAIGNNLEILMDEVTARNHDSYMKGAQQTGNSEIIGMGRELLARRKDGSEFSIEITVNQMVINDEIQFVGIIRDITARKTANEQARLADKIFESNSEGIVVTDSDCRILRVNSAFLRITGYSVPDIIGQTPKLLSSGRHDAVFYENMWRDLTTLGHWQGEIWNKRKSGEVYPEWLSLSVVYDEDGSISNYVGIFSDITDKKAAEERIYHMAHHDALTGLPNRTTFNMKLNEAISNQPHDDHQVAVLYMDLDHFKKINDTLGHPVGDELLKVVARRLKGVLRDSDMVCRIGGDEFIVMLQNIKKAEHAGQVAQNLVRALAPPIELAGRELFIGASIGIALFPQDATNVDELVKNADAALFRAKERGRNNYQFYSQEMNSKAIERLEMEAKLRRALEKEEFVLHFQPQLDLQNNRLVGVEALVRWQNDDLGLVPPNDFIPLLEDTGLIVPVGEWILQHACHCARSWQREGLGDIRVAVNISPQQFLYSDIIATVEESLRQSELPPGLLELEITEGSIMADAKANIHRLQQLSAMGIQLAIDDFGTGYSSLAYLKRFPIDALKIDQSFVRNMHEDLDDANIAAAIISLGHSLNLRIIAEGVEEKDHLERLQKLHCNEAQGYYISRPLPEHQLIAYLQSLQERQPLYG